MVAEETAVAVATAAGGAAGSRARAMKAVVLANGDPGGSDEWGRERLKAAKLVVAADGGAGTALRWGRTPDVVVGDLDSVDAEVRAALEMAGVEVERFPREKDRTDTEIALRAAQRRGATSIELLGALGGARLDHALANILLLALPALRGVPVTLRDERHTVNILRGDERVALTGVPGDLVTLLPLTPKVGGVTTTGLRYALRDERLMRGATRGVSNEQTAKRAAVRIGWGTLLVVTHHP